MNVTFVGCPSSGKTTTAAMLFAALKEIGTPVEFVPEYARQYIAAKRVRQQLAPHQRLELTDIDQMTIMHRQAELENTMSRACGSDVLIVSDTSPLNSLLYMSEKARNDIFVRHTLDFFVLPRIDLVFYLPPVTGFEVLDPNRIHSQADALRIDAQIPEIMQAQAPGVNLIRLDGHADQRMALAFSEIRRRQSR